MLKKIISIKNVGRFVSSALPGTPACAKYTQIFGANGYGKTTICAILRLLGANDPALIAGRARIGSKQAPEIELLLDDKVVRFANAAWSTAIPELLVFDGTFIAENVHSGDVVDLQQKRNLYRVIIGKEGVDLALEEERLAGESRDKGSGIRLAEKALQTHVPGDMKLSDFLTLSPDADIDGKITAQAKVVEAAREAGRLKVRAALTEVPFPALPIGLEDLLRKTLDGIAEDAQKRIADHIECHGMAEDGEAWVAEGIDHVADNKCPFCGQPIAGLALIEAYRTVFGERYREMKAAVANARVAVESDLGDRAAGAIETLFESNHSAAEFWTRYCELPKLDAPLEPPTAIATLRDVTIDLLSRKLAAPQDGVDLDRGYQTAYMQFQTAKASVEAYNSIVKTANAEIAMKKATVAASNIQKEEATLAYLNAQKRRHDSKVAPLCTEHQTLTNDKKALDARKAEVRAKLEEHTNNVIRPYEARINELLDNFNAGFRIAQTKPAYSGGVASSTYQLVINKVEIELGDGGTPLDRPSFKNTLSAGDRSTLALAFFIAHLERDLDRAKRIVVFDDPFTSQDSFRRRQTVYEIKKVGSACKQVIVLSHDATFLRLVRDKCPENESVTLQLADHRDLGIKIAACDLDEACRGRAASEMDDLQAYATTGAGKDRDIIKKMRIVLETYCRSTYPGSFVPDDRLGSMVEKIKKQGESHPAWAAVDEIEQVNDYSRDHHHGEDPQDGSADLIDPGELSGFVRRTLRLVNNLQG